MSWMFNECHKLKEIKGINKLNTSKVNTMNAMFQECWEIKYLDLSNFDTSNVTDMECMFCECYKLKEIRNKCLKYIKSSKYECYVSRM